MMKSAALTAAAAALLLAACTAPTPPAASTASAQPEVSWPVQWVSAEGAIALPEGFETWPTLGAWATQPQPGEAVNELHQVYVSPGAIEAYRANGDFPDGTVMVKEVRNAESAALTTGQASYATAPAVWFVMVRDSSARHAGNPLWAEGWGWALFEAADRGKQVAASYEAACQQCHIPAKDTNWIYADAYPVLRKTDAPTPAWKQAAAAQ